MLKSLINLV